MTLRETIRSLDKTTPKEIQIKTVRGCFSDGDVSKFKQVFDGLWERISEDSKSKSQITNSKFLRDFLKRSPVLGSSNRDARNSFEFILNEISDSIETFESAKRLKIPLDPKHFQIYRAWCVFALIIHSKFRK